MAETILFLDDMEVRHTAFQDYAAEYGFQVDHAYTSEEAIRKLEAGTEYAGAALDHDLAEEHYRQRFAGASTDGASADLSGRAVARWIADHGKPEKVLVHSFNPDGATVMHRTLTGAGIKATRLPFGPQSCRGWLAWLQGSAQ